MVSLLKLPNIARCLSTAANPLYFRITTPVFAEPLKKKRKIDPMIIKQREERKRKRLEKQIRKLEKSTKQFKPLEECEVPSEIENEKSLRTRTLNPLSEAELEERVKILKEWSVYRHKRQLADIKMCDRILISQQNALDELKLESEELYNAAIQIDNTLLPFKSKGPVETPAIANYDSPDGEYIDISKKWE